MAGVAIPEAVVRLGRAVGRAAAAAAAEAGAVAAEAEFAGAGAEAAAPIVVFPSRVAYVCLREPFVCDRLAAHDHVGHWHWRRYSFAEALSALFSRKRQFTLTFRLRFSSAFMDSVRVIFSIWRLVREMKERIEAFIRIRHCSL